jgi:hypothetical protein
MNAHSHVNFLNQQCPAIPWPEKYLLMYGKQCWLIFSLSSKEHIGMYDAVPYKDVPTHDRVNFSPIKFPKQKNMIDVIPSIHQ